MIKTKKIVKIFTTLKIPGLLDNPSDGNYYFGGVDVSGFRERQRTNLIGLKII
jgi:hypothetical protein